MKTWACMECGEPISGPPDDLDIWERQKWFDDNWVCADCEAERVKQDEQFSADYKVINQNYFGRPIPDNYFELCKRYNEGIPEHHWVRKHEVDARLKE